MIESRLSGYLASRAEKDCHGGRRCLELASGAPAARGGFGICRQRVDAKPFAGHRVRLTGWLKANLEADSRALLWLEGGQDYLSSKDADSRDQALSPGAWRQVSVDLDVPASATQLNLGLVLDGKGQVWLDDAALQVLGPQRTN